MFPYLHTSVCLNSVHIFWCKNNIMNEWDNVVREREMRFYVFCNITKANAQANNNLQPFHECFVYNTWQRLLYRFMCMFICFQKPTANVSALPLFLTRTIDRIVQRTGLRMPNSYSTRSYSFNAPTLCISFFWTGQYDCGAMAIIASLECSISIHIHWICIGTLLTKLIRTYVQIILFLRVANQLHNVFDKRMKENPINWRVTWNKWIKLGRWSARHYVISNYCGRDSF